MKKQGDIQILIDALIEISEVEKKSPFEEGDTLESVDISEYYNGNEDDALSLGIQVGEYALSEKARIALQNYEGSKINE